MQRVIEFLVVVMLSAAVCLPGNAWAAEGAGGAQLNAERSLADNLSALKGKTVTVTLASGQTISGVVKEVTNGLLHLERLSQKDFYDALIVVDKIGAVEVRVR